VSPTTHSSSAGRIHGFYLIYVISPSSEHSDTLSPQDREIIYTSLDLMIEHLDRAAVTSADPPDAPHIETTQLVYSGQPGCPCVEINYDILATALEMQNPTALEPIFETSARTIWCRALEYGLVQPGPPVYSKHQAADGSIEHQYTSTTTPTSDLSDDALDVIIRQIIDIFPTFGQRMMTGYLRSLGYCIPRPRVEGAYMHIHGPPAAQFGPRRIERRVYSVPGPNSLWHHDGQHGEIGSAVSALC
jgi:hypothetical protein